MNWRIIGSANLVTCDRAEEMYINEGFAEYLSYLFLEQVYGRDRLHERGAQQPPEAWSTVRI